MMKRILLSKKIFLESNKYGAVKLGDETAKDVIKIELNGEIKKLRMN